MTDTDKPAFLDVVKYLAIALREPPLDSMQLRVYFNALIDCDIEFVTLAAKDLSTSAKFFPKPAEWRAAVTVIEKQRRREQQDLLRKLHARGLVLCPTCSDNQMVENLGTGRYDHCACQTQRRQELLGRRPWPALPSAPPHQQESNS